MESSRLHNLNVDLLVRKCAFTQGTLVYENRFEPTDPKHPKAKPKFLSCATMPDVLPIRPKQSKPSNKIDEALEMLPQEEGLQGHQGLIPNNGDHHVPDISEADINPSQARDLNFSTPITETDLVSNFELVQTRKIQYDLPILIIYNPNSGKKANLYNLIVARLTTANLPFVFKYSTIDNLPYKIAHDTDYSQYSMLVACGGDGTYHEVVNGMLARKDKQKLPLAFLPNGSGNDTCTSMGVMNLSDALDYIVNGEVIAIDTIKCLVDYDKEEDIPAQEYNSKCRHMIINGCLAMPARVVVQAQKYKACCGKMCYSAASIEQSLTGGIKEELLYVEVDGKPMEPISTIFMMFFNGSYTGGGLQCEPFACMNDGLLDLTFLHNTRKNNLTGVADLLDKAKKGGVHIFDRDQTYVRGKHIKVRYGGVKNRQPKEGGWGDQALGLDGEQLRWRDTLSLECVPGNIECVFDSQRYWQKYRLFK